LEVEVTIFVGDDWAEDHHDVHVMNDAGQRLAARCLPEGVAGITAFHALVAQHVDDPGEVVIGTETDRGLWVTALVVAGYQLYAVNPLAASRYRDRHHVGGAKSDAGDAKMLADLVRTDRQNHRLIAGDSADVEGIKIVARGHQSLIWMRTGQSNMLRSSLLQYYPAALQLSDELTDRDTLAVLAKAPTPAQGARLSLGQIAAVLKRGGRQRNLDKRALEIQTVLRADTHLAAAAAVADAFAATTSALVGIIVEMNRHIAQLAAELADRFKQHPDADIYLSLPGFGVVLGARALGEFGDDPNRYTDAKARRNYAGTSPLTVASGRKKLVKARYVRNQRLYDALDQAAFCALQQSPGCRLFYDQRRAVGDLHHQALRALANRLVGYLHGCLANRTLYNEDTAWAHRQPAPLAAAAA
jgi:Transposase/Transposase IS116/IS110/IS902 family